MSNDHASGRVLRRRQAVLALVRARAVRSQGALARLLRRRGIRVAQPTLSRDLRALGLVRTPAGYRPAAAAAAGRDRAALLRALSRSVLEVRAAGGLVVVRTPPGGAAPVARALDEAGLPGVAGTIAGDDTVFVAAAGPGAARRLEARLRAALGARGAGR
jgi:transcriptional regulator of arginine metabolism